MPRLYNQATGATLGELTDAQLQFLVDNLEEEDTKDRDYYIDQATLDMLRERGGDSALLDLLEGALNDAGSDADGVDIAWE